MNACPACNQPVSTSHLNCPHCGISLHPDAPTGPAEGGRSSLSVAGIAGITIIGILVIGGCLGALGFGMFYTRTEMLVMPPTPPPVPMSSPVIEESSSQPEEVPPAEALPSDAN